jgi:hypothetical protein
MWSELLDPDAEWVAIPQGGHVALGAVAYGLGDHLRPMAEEKGSPPMPALPC